MLLQFAIHSTREFDFKEFSELLGAEELLLVFSCAENLKQAWTFCRKGKSTTLFLLQRDAGDYMLYLDKLASYDDYRLFPYLIDSLNVYLTDMSFEDDGKSAFKVFNDEWIEECIGEEVAYLKCTLKLGLQYFLSLPLDENHCCISANMLNRYGVSIYSSTPRIYGYCQYAMRCGCLELPNDDICLDITEEEIEVDVPQHISIGTVISWQTDGSQATESYSREDVNLLLQLAKEYSCGKQLDGVVLNDIGTIHEYAIGIERDAEKAVYWFKEAVKQGDLLYAATSLGDIYRRGLDSVKMDLRLALEAYMLSEDPYAWYRIGQAFEEGWVSEPDMVKAMEYYRKAAAVGHHLALKRLAYQYNIDK